MRRVIDGLLFSIQIILGWIAIGLVNLGGAVLLMLLVGTSPDGHYSGLVFAVVIGGGLVLIALLRWPQWWTDPRRAVVTLGLGFLAFLAFIVAPTPKAGLGPHDIARWFTGGS